MEGVIGIYGVKTYFYRSFGDKYLRVHFILAWVISVLSSQGQSRETSLRRRSHLLSFVDDLYLDGVKLWEKFEVFLCRWECHSCYFRPVLLLMTAVESTIDVLPLPCRGST